MTDTRFSLFSSDGRISMPPLMLAGSLLALILIVAAGFWLWRAEYRSAEEAVRRNADLVAAFTQRVLGAQEQLLHYAEAIATPTRLQTHRGLVAEQLADLIAAEGESLGVSVVDPDGRSVVTNQSATPQLDVADRPYFQVLRDEDLAVYVDRVEVFPTGTDAIVVARRRAGTHFSGILVTAIEARVFSEFFATLATPDGDAASLTRTDGVLLMRHDLDYPAVALARTSPIFRAIAGDLPATYEVVAQTDGVRRLYATQPVDSFPLYASYGMPLANIWAAWRERMTLVVTGVGAAALLGLLVVAELRRRLQRRHDAQLLAESQRAAEHRKVMFQELNHRVKNNLQLVHSLLRLSGRGGSCELRQVLNEVAQRVNAIGLVHEELEVARGNPTVRLDRLIERLAGNPSIVPPEQSIAINCRSEPVVLSVERAIPAALIGVEAMTNAVKHAFPDGRPGTIDIELRVRDEQVELEVIDDGVGTSIELSTVETSGLGLVQALARQLGGAATLSTGRGIALGVSFPLLNGASAA